LTLLCLFLIIINNGLLSEDSNKEVGMILNVKQIAEFFLINKDLTCKLAKGRKTCHKNWAEWRLRKGLIDKWI